MNNPKKGFDPVPKEYAIQYSEKVYLNIDNELIKDVLYFFGEIKDKTLVDLGGGPGQYSIEFAKLGAKLIWHDISKNYLEIVQKKAKESDIKIHKFILDYMDSINYPIDFVFSRVCFYYSINDRTFLNRIIKCLNNGGKAYITLHNEDFIPSNTNQQNKLKKIISNLFAKLNNVTGIKIGHPHMSKKRIEKLFSSFKVNSLQIVHDSKGTTTIKIIK
jgi:SAM-dependent methyltransferase